MSSLPSLPQADHVLPTAPARHPGRRIRVWDLPTRLFHWSLVTAVLTAVVTGQIGGDWMVVHGRAGLACIGLVTFRLVWGVVGATHARFLHFAPTPARLRAYLRGQWQGVGHNPLGALSVFALLGLVGTQAVTGLFSNDDIAFAGPLAALVSEEASSRLTGLHHLAADALLAFVGLHLLAILFYAFVKKDDLISPMVTGDKVGEHGEPTRAGSWPALVLALVLAAAATAVASGVFWRVPPAPAAAPQTQAPSPNW
jgi:cytochrome b